jgi:hypothetical protein
MSGYVNLQIRSTLYHMLVRYYVTRRIYDETGSQTLQGLTNFARPKPIVTKELRVKIVERIAHGAPDDALGIDIDYRGQDFRHGQNGWFRSRISLCKTRRCCSDHQGRRDRGNGTIFQTHTRSK